MPNFETIQIKNPFKIHPKPYNISNIDEPIKSPNASLDLSTIYEASKNAILDKSKEIIVWIKEFFKVAP